MIYIRDIKDIVSFDNMVWVSNDQKSDGQLYGYSYSGVAPFLSSVNISDFLPVTDDFKYPLSTIGNNKIYIDYNINKKFKNIDELQNFLYHVEDDQ